MEAESTPPESVEALQQLASREPRVQVLKAPLNAPAVCRGEYIAFLDAGDEFAAFALLEIVRAINESPEIDVFYSDEDKLNEAGRRCEPFLKPDWSPDLFLSFNYIGRLVVCKRWVVEQTGGLGETCRLETPDYAFLLRGIECTQKIKRIPKVLYHRRDIPATAAVPQKGAACEAGADALRGYLERNCPGARMDHFLPCRYRVIYPVDLSQKVTIIMPSGGNLHFLEPVLKDLFHRTSYPNFEVLIVDNSRSSDVQQLVNRWQQRGKPARHLDRRHQPFNYSRLNNDGVAYVDSPLILLLNDDMTVINEDWLTAMVEQAQRKEVGAVGALLLYPDGRVQHGGVVMGVSGNAEHLFKKLTPTPGVCFDLPLVVRNCSAVTAACLMTRREAYLEVNGLDEQNLAVAFQDTDFCLKLHQRHYRIVYTPFARLYHHESVTKAEKIPNPAEVRFMQEKWRAYIDDDPYYNPNLTRKDEQYNLRLE